MSQWEANPQLDYSATGDDIDTASQKIIQMFNDVYEKLNRLRKMDASAGSSVGDAEPFSFKIDTSVNPPALLCRNAAGTGYVQIGSIAENLGLDADTIGGIQGDGNIGSIKLGTEANLPATATTYDLYFAYDTGRLYMFLTGAWRVFLSLRFEDLLGISDSVIEREEVALNGANKIPKLNEAGQGVFDITGSAAKIGGKNLYLPEIPDGCVLVFNATRDRWEVAARDDITNADVSTTGEPNKIVKADANGAIQNDTKGNAAKIATKTIDVSNLQDGDVLVYDATTGTFKNKQGAVVNEQGVVEANVSGSAQKWAGKAIQTVNMVDGQILVWSEANQAFINRNQSAVGNARALSLKQDGVELANYNGDEYRAVNIITPHLRVAGQAYTAGQTCFSKNMASTLYLECVTAGVTANVEPDFSTAAVGDVVADGGAEWKVCGYVNSEVTDALEADLATKGIPVGYITPFLQSTAPDGWLSCSGAEVSRAAYPDLWNYINGSSLLISESDWQAKNTSGEKNIGWYSSGDGTTTFRLPRIVGSGELTEVKRFTTAGDGTFVAPVTGIYRITLQGAGGGGGGAGSSSSSIHYSGAGGGEGGNFSFYEELVAGTSYSYTIGAGGAGGSAGTASTHGAAGVAGGASSITVNGNDYVAQGGWGALGVPDVADAGGRGGDFTINDVVVSRGSAGTSGRHQTQTQYATTGGIGGGASGLASTVAAFNQSIAGGGGVGGTLTSGGSYNAGQAGGDGYIEFAYNPVPQYWYARAFGSATNQGTVDITELANMLNDKADIDEVLPLFGGGALTGNNLTWNGADLGGASIVAQSLGANGYIKYSNGLIVQWGSNSINLSETKLKDIPLNISMNVLDVIITDYTWTSEQKAANIRYSWFTGSSTTTSFKVAVDGTAAIGGFYWLAIGF